MTKGKNIAKQEILFAVANEVSTAIAEFDIDLFKADFFNDRGLEAFRADLNLVSAYRIHRFPSLVVKRHGSKGIVLSGYRPLEEIIKTIDSLPHANT